MSTLPPARVVRDGGEPAIASDGSRPERVLALAPRKIPQPLIWRLWFGTPIAKFGWLFAAFGMIFNLLFLPRGELFTPPYDAFAEGTVVDVEQTNSSENKRPIHRVSYTFQDGAGVTHTGISYSKNPDFTGTVRVEYMSTSPDRSRIEGARSKPFGWWVIMVMVFPIAGLAIALPQLRTGLRSTRLLRYGVETRGKLTDREATDTKLNGEPVIAMTFEYEVDGGTRHVVVMKTLSPELLADDALEPMLYDPHAPARATTLDHLPGSPRLTADGRIESKPGLAAHLLVCPVATVALIVATIWTLMR